jgi:exosortase
MTLDTHPNSLCSSRTILIVSVLLLSAFTVIFWNFISAQFGFAITNPGDWGHTLLVPLVVAWLIWSRRDELLKHPVRCSRTGLLVVCLGVLLYVLALIGPGLLQSHNAKSVGVGVTLWGIAVTLFGWRSLRVLWFPLLYLVVFGQFLSDDVIAPVTERMQDIATIGSAFTFELLGYDVVRHGELLTLDSGGDARPLDVAEACSGMRMLMAFLALGTLLAWTRLPRAWQRIVLVGLAFPIAIVVNIMRITVQGILDGFDAEFTVGAAHSILSTIWLLPAFLIFLFFLWVLDGFNDENESASDPPVPSEVSVRIAPGSSMVCGVLLFFLLSCAVFLQSLLSISGIRLVKSPAPLRAAFETLSPSLGEWRKRGEDVSYSEGVVNVLGTRAYLDRVYIRDSGDTSDSLRVHLAHYTGGFTSRPHLPERCWSVQGLVQINDTVVRSLDPTLFIGRDADSPRKVEAVHPVTGYSQEVWLPAGDPAIRVTVFSDPALPGSRLLAGYFFIANGRLASGSREARSLAYNLQEEWAFFTKIQFASRVPETELSTDRLVDSFVDMIEDMLAPMMPEVMRMLPSSLGPVPVALTR